MKSIYPIILLVVAAFFNQAKAQYPIPSYNIPVQGKATFQEDDHQKSSDKGIKRIRTINVRSTGFQQLKSQLSASVWIYSLDGQDRYGPYLLPCDETISFEIDDRLWGVFITPEDEIIVDVWIE